MTATRASAHRRPGRKVTLEDGFTYTEADRFSSLVPVVFQICCAAWDCADAWTPKTPPLRLEGSRREVEGELRRRGWRPAYTRGAWHCPTHSAVRERRPTTS